MLLLALTRHAALFPVPDVFETFVFIRPRAFLSDPVPGMMRAYIGGAEGVSALRSLVGGLGRDEGDLSDDDLIRAFFWLAAERVYPGRRPLEKTPSHVHALPALFRIFPQARVLACVRDPVDIRASYRKRLAREQALGKPPEAWAWLALSDEQFVGGLRRVNKALREIGQARPGQVFQVPYAWITMQPEPALRQICAFIGEPFDSAMLTPRAEAKSRIDPRLSEPIAAQPPPTLDRPSAASGPAPSGPAPAPLADDKAKLIDDLSGLARRWRRSGPLPLSEPGPPAP